MARKPRKEHHEEHADETWLIPYADLLTLLLALFIVLFASSQIDQKKLEQMSTSFNIAFSGQTFVHDKQNSVQQINPVPQIQPPSINMPNFNVVPAAAPIDERAFLRETQELLEVKRKLDAFIAEHGLESYLSTHLTEEGLMIRIKETALFPSGSSAINPTGRLLAEQIAKMLVTLTQQVTISGHTDNVPINTINFPSNWELSSSRAVNFTRLILSYGGVGPNGAPLLNPQRFRAVGYSEYRPVETNATDEGRASNRRVEVFIVRNYLM
jgi:chemotaxis protein MotB